MFSFKASVTGARDGEWVEVEVGDPYHSVWRLQPWGTKVLWAEEVLCTTLRGSQGHRESKVQWTEEPLCWELTL